VRPGHQRYAAGVSNVPVGSRVAQVAWLATPDKYSGPKLFGDLAKARAYGGSGSIITAELELTTPDGGSVTVSGGVPSTDTLWRDSPRQDPGVFPAEGARLVAAEDGELVFTNPPGGRWVLIV